jgi:inorganic pyrophosphatase
VTRAADEPSRHTADHEVTCSSAPFWLGASVGLLALAQASGPPPRALPATATTRLVQSLDAAKRHGRHLWRDTPPFNADGTANAYIEISLGDRRKWEYDMGANARAVDRVMPPGVGGYPVNYGFVPQTISYDGDPFDALVLGPPIDGGTIVRGAIVGLMQMVDEKGLDPKVVLAPVAADRRETHRLTDGDQRTIGDFFNRYKRHEPGKFSTVPGWGSVSQGAAYVRTTHAFFVECRQRPGTACDVP